MAYTSFAVFLVFQLLSLLAAMLFVALGYIILDGVRHMQDADMWIGSCDEITSQADLMVAIFSLAIH